MVATIQTGPSKGRKGSKGGDANVALHVWSKVELHSILCRIHWKRMMKVCTGQNFFSCIAGARHGLSTIGICERLK